MEKGEEGRGRQTDRRGREREDRAGKGWAGRVREGQGEAQSSSSSSGGGERAAHHTPPHLPHATAATCTFLC